MTTLSKTAFKNKLNQAYIRTNHISDRKLDYKYHEYNLFIILSKYTNDYDYSVLGMPANIEIITYPSRNDYNIDARSHVTLNTELYKLYTCGYFEDEANFVKYVNSAINKYSKGTSIKKLADHIRKIRLRYIDKLNKGLWFYKPFNILHMLILYKLILVALCY